MWGWWLLVSTIGCILVTIIYEIRVWKRIPKGASGPVTLPFLGTTLSFLRNADRILEYFVELNQTYGNSAATWSHGWTPQLFITLFEPKSVKHFLQDNFRNYERYSDNGRFITLFGSGIFRANGAHWKKQRQTARPLFAQNSLQAVQSIFVARTQNVLDLLETFAKERKEVDIQNIYMRFTLDSIGEVGFGYNINSLEKPVAFSVAFDRAQQIIDENDTNPFLRYLPDKEFDDCVKTLRSFSMDIIRKRRTEKDLEKRPDMLSRFLLINDPDTNEPLSDEMLTDILLNFFIAGRDTTAILLTWTTWLIAQHPDVEERLLREIEEVIGQEEPTWDTLKQLKYLKNVLDETLRLYPPVPLDVRRAIEDDVLPNGQVIEAGAMAVYSAYVMGRSEKYWDRPLQFDPDRWDKPIKEPYAFVPFHAGPQLCLGRPLAYQEAKTMLVMLLRKYKLKLVPGHLVVPKRAIVMPTRYGVKVTVHPRQ